MVQPPYSQLSTFFYPHKLLPVSVYFLPESSLSHSLLGVSLLIRPQGRCVFTNSSCLLFDSPQSTVPFLQGTKNPNSDLWFLQVPPQPPPNHSPTILFSLQELPCARFVAYWHRAFGSPSLSTFLDALASDYISIPRLTPALVRKYPPLSCATAFGHLDTLRQGIASTRRSPSPHALGSVATRQSRRRFAFLKDCDDLEKLKSSALPVSAALPVSLRRSVRLASTSSSPDTKVSTLHRSEWTAADLTARFPIPSYKGHDYILVTKHLGFIHLLPMKTRSAPAYVSALKKVLLFFSSKSFSISHLILDNETSAILTTFLVSENVSFQHVPPYQH
jgi:hypothetical protein